MAIPLAVLILEDNTADAELVLHALRRAGFAPLARRVDTEAAYLAALDPTLDLVLADYALPQFDALRALGLLREHGLDIPFIIVSGTIGEELAVAAIRHGADDYLLKDRLARLGLAVTRALEQRRLRHAMREATAALEANAQLNRAVLRSLSAELAVLDQRGVIIAVNEAWERFGGLQDNPISLLGCSIGVNYLEVCRGAVAQGDPEAAISMAGIQAVLDGQMLHFTQEYSCPTPEGKRWFLMQVTPLSEQGGVVVAHQEISERKRAEQALHAAEVKYRTLVEHIPAIVYMAAIDQVSSTLYVNSQIETMLGFSPQEWTTDPHRWIKQVHPFDLDEVLAGVLRARDGSVPNRSEFRMIARDGRVVWFRDEAVVVRDPVGQPLFLQGVMLDITERKQAEQALRESEERYRLITENSGDLIALVDQEGQFIYASPSFQQILGYDPVALLGSYATDLLHDEDQAALPTFEQQISNTGIAQMMLRMRHADGSWRWMEGQVTAVLKQGVRQTLMIGRDMTERRRLEAQFLQAQKMESVGQLAGGVAHDFNNLLTAIHGHAEFALADLPADNPVRSDLEAILKAAGGAATLTRQLLSFARKQVMESRVLNMNDLIGASEQLLRRMLGEAVQLVLRLAPDLGPIKADSGQIEQVLMNLAINAHDAMPEGGILTIETCNRELAWAEAQQIGLSPGPHVCVLFSDTGAGIDAATQERIFEPFFTTKRPGHGTGLGLAMCYGTVRQHGGQIWVASEPQQGAVFTICLPRSKAPVDSLPEPLGRNALPQGHETVLLAEDNPAVRDLAARVLREQGYTVLEADDGVVALSLAQSYGYQQIHLLLTDVVMPNMNGKVLFERLNQQRPGLKALFISGYADDVIAKHGQLEARAGFLNKPFSPATLARKVRAILDEQA